jgi:uncharacterized protein (DUF2384 family)
MILGEVSTFPALSRDDLAKRLALVVEELIKLYGVRAHLRAEERRKKTRAYLASTESSYAARDREATNAALDITLLLLESDGEIAAFEAARDLIVELRR